MVGTYQGWVRVDIASRNGYSLSMLGMVGHSLTRVTESPANSRENTEGLHIFLFSFVLFALLLALLQEAIVLREGLVQS